MAPHAGHGLPALVSIHAPAWGATPSSCPLGLRSGRFNPRTRVGCDALPRCSRESGPSFQSTHPRGVRPRTTAPHFGEHRFNPRTRVGCDAATSVQTVGLTRVSIHAPAWGATRDGQMALSAILFQSTHPRGVRPSSVPYPHVDGRVSIHAPAWGATRRMGDVARRGQGFNPRTRVGCDVSVRSQKCHDPCFNPRTRVGCDQGLGAWVAPTARFNPRTRVGCDTCHTR